MDSGAERLSIASLASRVILTAFTDVTLLYYCYITASSNRISRMRL